LHEEVAMQRTGLGPILEEKGRIGPVLEEMVGIDPVLAKKDLIRASMKEKAGTGPHNRESAMSARSAATIKNIHAEARPEAGKSTDFDQPVTPHLSEVEEGGVDDIEEEARPEGGKVSLLESGDLHEGGRSNEVTMYEWILNLWKSFRNIFSLKILTIFEL
jgi:hypothetical protein